MAELLARTRRLDGAVDLGAFAAARPDGVLFVRDGAGLAGCGAVARTARADVDAVLGAIAVDDEVDRPGSGAVAIGALPFLPDSPGELVVPELVVGRGADGSAWATAIGPAGHTVDPVEAVGAVLEGVTDSATGSGSGGDGPASFTVTPSRSPESWCRSVSEATGRIRAGELEKVVLAREVVVTADQAIGLAPLVARLRAGYPECFVYCIDGFVGASPELLVSRHDDVVRAQPMAGTTARRGDPQADARAAAALLANASYRHEHQVTIDMVHDTLLAFCSYLDYEPEPSVVALANVAHLATTVEGRLSHPAASVMELVRVLHPTPAVCGRPRAAALAVIAELEGFDRGRYAGAVGWVDGAGNGQWAVAIRSAQVRGAEARVIAGNGIVADSDPLTELAETRAKLQALLGAIVRP